MTHGVNVKVVEDDSVELKLQKVALRLSKKYNKKRVINENLLKKPPLYRRIIRGVLSCANTVFISFCLIFVGITVYNKMNNMPASCAGYFSMQIASGSMENSGFYKGDTVIVRAVDTKTLHANDIIAFYANDSHINEKYLTEVENTNPVKSKLTLSTFFGILSPEIKQVARSNKLLVFHHIQAVYEDANGTRYFKTYGSSNLVPKTNEIAVDNWLINENMVVGCYDNSIGSQISARVINILTTPIALTIVLFIPVAYLIYVLLRNTLKNVQLAFLECDVVEEKRRLTDEICVKNGIGYRMSTKTKYKVLAQAPEGQKLEYVNLLWKTDNRPENIRKYYLRKGLILRPLQKLRDVNRNCEQMFKDGVKPTKIAKYYTEEKEKIQAEQKRYKALVRKIGENAALAMQTEETAAAPKVKIATQAKKPASKATQAKKQTKSKTTKRPSTKASSKPATKKQAVAKPTKNITKNNKKATK